MTKQFRNNLEFVESGYDACWRNATDLRESAELLLEKGRFSLSLSVSVLSMEEIGKMFLIDGLLFARSGDYKADAFGKGHNRHQSKLLALELFPLFIQSLATNDSRYGTYQYNTAIAVTLKNFKNERSALAEFGINSFVELDAWKQKGFYASESGGVIVAPNEVISEGFTRAVVDIARRFTTTVDFLLEDGNLEKYFQLASKIRGSLSADDWKRVDEESDILFEETKAELDLI